MLLVTTGVFFLLPLSVWNMFKPPGKCFFSWMINENEVNNRNWKKKKTNLFCHSLPRSVWINRNPNHKSQISDFQGLIQTIINYVAEQKKNSVTEMWLLFGVKLWAGSKITFLGTRSLCRTRHVNSQAANSPTLLINSRKPLVNSPKVHINQLADIPVTALRRHT